jgi:hypothetical protein
MKQFAALCCFAIIFVSCNKDKFTAEPKISFNSITPNYWTSNNTGFFGPKLSFNLKDAEGDFGFEDASISYVYIRNAADTLTPPDSLAFPNMPITGNRNLDIDVEVDIVSILPPAHIPGNYTDTLFFDVFVKDFAGHKSNVIRTITPLYYYTP